MRKTDLILVGLAVVLLCIFGSWYYLRISAPPAYQTPSPEPPGHGVVGNAKLDQDPYDVLIDYTDDGYASTSVTVKQGTRVRFLNSSSMQEWPASGVHPTHTLYPEKESSDCLGSSFDSCETLSRGEFYDFTFYYIGDWPFHDHLHAYNAGDITVVQ